MIRTLLFDCDGTLLNTLPLIVHCFSTVSEEYTGKPLTDKEVLARFGPTETEMLRQMLPDEAQFEQAVSRFYEIYEAHHANYVEPNESLFKMIADLRGKGYQIGMVTGKGRRSLTLDLKRVGIADVFEVLITGDDVSEPKPSPEGLLDAMRKLGADPNTTLYVGDSNDDMRAAHAAGVTAVAAQWLQRPQTDSYECNPDFIVRSVDDLQQFLGSETIAD